MRKLTRSNGWGLVVILLGAAMLFIASCGGGSDGGGDTAADDNRAVRKVASAFQGPDLTNSLAAQTVGIDAANATQVASPGGFGLDHLTDTVATAIQSDGGWSDVSNATRDIDRTIDLDTMVNGTDIFPYASGQVRVTGTATITGDPKTTGTISIDPLRITFLTDVVITDPESKATSTYAKDAYIDFSVTGTYTVTGSSLTCILNISTTTGNLNVTINADGETTTFGVNVTLESNIEYVDTDVTDDTAGGMTRNIFQATVNVTWTDRITYNLTVTVKIDKSTTPATEEITLTLNGRTFGPYTVAEFIEKWGAYLLIEDPYTD